MPTNAERAELQLGTGMPVVQVMRSYYDEHDLVVEVQDTVASADRHSFRYEVTL